jgi:hypothetical protein
MGFSAWLKRVFRRGDGSAEMVRFLDVETGRVVQIPALELRPGTIQVQMEGIGLVWALPHQFKDGGVRHAPFDERVRAYIHQIHETFGEHRHLSFDEWEDGFRRDAKPEREIALWSHAADVYTVFACDEPSPERRKDVYRCVVACLTATPDTVWHVLKPTLLSRGEAEQIVNGFYGKTA